MRHLYRVLVAALGIAIQTNVSVAQRPSQSQEESLLAAARKVVETTGLLGLQSLEPSALGTASGSAERETGGLLLHLKSGRTKLYKNRAECASPDTESKCQTYSFVVHASSRGLFIVAHLYYEDVEYLLVDDETGDETTVRNFPFFSPSGNRVLVLLMNDDQVGFAVQIWRHDGHKFILEWSRSPYTEGTYTSYELLRWPTDNTVELRSKTDFEPPIPSVGRNFELRHTSRGWNVVETR